MIDEGRKIDEQNTERRARILNVQYVDTSNRQFELYKDILSLSELYSLKIVPLVADQHNIQFGITNNTSHEHMESLRRRFSDQQISFAMISDSGFRDLMKLYDPPKEVVYEDIALSQVVNSNQLEAVSQTLNSVRADDMLAYIVQQAYRLKASDIHLENSDDLVRVRLRVDGVLHPVAELSKEKFRLLISSLASAANISTNVTESQTGHINQSATMADGSKVSINLRVESVSALYGMDIVLRLFNLQPELMRLNKLDLNNNEREIIYDIIRHPTGLVLAVGPTGSGKTTTLYSIINELNTPERKIITLEDPVEFYIKGVTQIPTSSSNNPTAFADGFRAVLRLDPDVIMVGEIRDNDTAKTALQSALTGHLVLSTYHASSACAALTRMLDAIGDNPLFTSAIRLVSAQRLVRRLDDSSKKAYKPDDKTKQWLNDIIATFPANIERPNIDNIELYEPGSSESNPFGYTGQFAIRELLVMTPALQNELQKPKNEISTESLQKIAVENGMLTMLQDGVLKVLKGDTSLQEVLRVIG